MFFCLFCFLSWNWKDLQFFFIYFYFNIILHFILKFKLLFFTTSFIIIYFDRFYGSYQGAECLPSTFAGFFVGGVHWQWPWTLLRINPRVLGDILHSVMLPCLFLCNISTINLGMQRCIQSLVKHQRQSFFVKGVNGSSSLAVFAKNLVLGCLSSECTSGMF